ncbi:MAG: copper amine oxidase N-terminal domain-containing protein, partial [Bacillota bacterium]|nr:copper amine oxidase N-terminal domain-containing protein [Bacillota bacterium]
FTATGLFSFLGNASGITLPGATPPAPGVANVVAPAAGATVASVPTGNTYTIGGVVYDAAAVTTSGAIAISGLRIVVDEKVAKVGQDIEVKVSGDGVTTQTIVVAQYVDFIANVIEDTTTELTAGLAEQKLGTFFIEEVAPGTLVQNRTILFELPAGVEWHTQAIGPSNYEMANNSSISFNASGVTPLDARTLKFTVGNTSAGAQNGAKVKFKDLKVDVSPSFTGDVILTVKGKAGVEGTAKLATVSPMITMTASTPEVNLGIKEQKVSDVEIVETKADTIVARATALLPAGLTTRDTNMAFYLDSGFRFAKVPKVEVIEGDMVLEVADVKIQAPAGGQNLLIVPIRAASYKTPAKIKISDIYVTADRNAPVGDVILYAADTNTYADVGLCNAFNNTDRASFRYDTPASVAIAKNVTVPPVEVAGGTGSGTFVIGSNIYTVNGLTKVMDVAPYIKNDRTYVPYRYLALALGVAEDDIVWDAAAQKVTVTKGENTVEAVIGSTTLTVNGSAVTMDVAPEISNSRTMLPARFLAEALGATVGWDPATRTVVFEM